MADLHLTFGEYFKKRRIELRKTLRGFCREHNLDPGNISKLERGRASAPNNEATIFKYASYLNLPTDDYEVFRDLAAISAARIPKDLTDAELAKRLPVLFKVLRNKEVTEADLRAFVEIVRNAS